MEVIKVFVKYHINITQINSKMMNNEENEQALFIDFDGHKKDEVVQNLLKELDTICNNTRVIGSYTKF